MEMIKVKRYQVECNPTPFRSSSAYSIEEFFVGQPYNIAFNYASPVYADQKATLNIFSAKEPRDKKPRDKKDMTVVEMPKDTIIKLKNLCDMKEKLEKDKDDFMKNETAIFDKVSSKKKKTRSFGSDSEDE